MSANLQPSRIKAGLMTLQATTGSTNILLLKNISGSTVACITNTGLISGVTINHVIKTVTGTTYTALSADNSKTLEFTHTGLTTITLPTGLTTGYIINIINYGGATSATKTFAAGSGASIKSKSSKLALATQYDGATAYYRGGGIWVLVGDLT